MLYDTVCDVKICLDMWDFLRHTGISGLAKFLYGII